jgi:hypothetical protein
VAGPGAQAGVADPPAVDLDLVLLAVLERRDRRGKEIAGAAASGKSMVEGMAASARHATDHPGLAKLYVTLSAAATDPKSPAHDYFTERYRAVDAEVTRELEAQQKAGALRADQPAGHLAGAVPAVMDGLQIQWMHDHTVDIAAIAETVTRILAPSAGAGQETKPAD